MSLLNKFKIGLKKSSENFSSGLKNLIVNKKIDEDALIELEEFLIVSDVGITTAEELKNIFSKNKINPNENKINQINSIIEKYIIDLII